MGNEAVLIVALSGRALAASARRGGFRPLVADMFGDQDTLHAAYAHVRLVGDLASGLEKQALIPALEALGRGQEPIGLVCGTGFEDRTPLLQCLAERWRLLGNRPEVVAKAKNPDYLWSLCTGSGIPFPEVSPSPPPNPSEWLIKRTGGAGGAHIRPPGQAESGGRFYYQRKVSGAPVAAAFLANGQRATILGFSSQWSSPTPRQPYRYGGAVRPARLAPCIEHSLTAVVERITAALSLVGLNSMDFLVDGERFWLLDVNPRPGATLDIFETEDDSLFARHVAACTGRPVSGSRYPRGATAAEIVYAEDDIRSVPALDWPDWTTDRPVSGTTIKAGEPVCTVHARSLAVAEARALAEKRRRTVLSWTSARS